MTNEQAKKMLKAKLECLKRETSGTDFDCNNSNCDECSLCYEQGNMGEQKQALDMAIKALEQQPCEDAISRQAAIEVAKQYWYKPDIAGTLEELPSVHPKPKTGHWIGTRRVGCGFGEYKEYIVPIKDGIVTDSCHCSECGEWLTRSDEYECSARYCPNCGAKMEEVEE